MMNSSIGGAARHGQHSGAAAAGMIRARDKFSFKRKASTVEAVSLMNSALSGALNDALNDAMVKEHSDL